MFKKSEKVEHAADAAAGQAKQHHLLRPELVGIAPGVRPADERREVLHANDQARQDRVKTQTVMHKARQHRQRQANGQIADKGKCHE